MKSWKTLATLWVGFAVLSWMACHALAQQAESHESANYHSEVEASEGTAQEDPPTDPEKQNSFWMEQKLRLSKELLTGLAAGDFEMIGKSAEVMRGLNRVESFVRRSPEGYRDYLKQFNMATNSLIRSSAEENLEGATLAFNQLTISCVNCHRQLRSGE